MYSIVRDGNTYYETHVCVKPTFLILKFPIFNLRVCITQHKKEQ